MLGGGGYSWFDVECPLCGGHRVVIEIFLSIVRFFNTPTLSMSEGFLLMQSFS